MPVRNGRGRVQRLHRHVRKEGQLVVRRVRPVRGGQCRVEIAVAARHDGRLAGECLMEGAEDVGRVLDAGPGPVPLDLQRIAALQRGPGIGGQDCHPGAQPGQVRRNQPATGCGRIDDDDVNDPADPARPRRIYAAQPGAPAGRPGDDGRQCAGRAHVESVQRLAANDSGSIHVRTRRADDPVVAWRLERDVHRHRQPRRLGRQLAIAQAAIAGSQHPSRAGEARCRLDLPARGRSRHEHHPGRCAGLAQRLEAEQQAQAAAGELVVQPSVQRRLDHLDLFPVHLQFLSHDHGQRGPDALADLRVLGKDGDAIVGGDADQRVQLRRDRLPLRRAVRGGTAEPDDQAAARGNGQHQEGSAVQALHGVPPARRQWNALCHDGAGDGEYGPAPMAGIGVGCAPPGPARAQFPGGIA